MRIRPFPSFLLRAALLAALSTTTFPATLPAEPAEISWNQFRGPDRSAVFQGTDLLRTWPEGGPREVWRQPLGSGFSGFASAGDRFFTAFAEKGRSYLASFRLESGEEVWRLEIGPSFTDEFGTGPRATPSLADDKVIVLSARGRLVAAEIATGREIWQVDLFEDFGFYGAQMSVSGMTEPGHQLPQWGYTASPLVEHGLVLVDTGHGEGESFLAFDLATGAKKWGALDSPVGYSSPLAITVGDSRHLVVQTPEEVVGLGTDGRIRWRHSWFYSVAQPLFLPPDRIFVSTVNQETTARVFRIGADEEGSGFTTETVWENRSMRNFWNSSLAFRGAVYGFDNATLRCLDGATGELRWAKRGLGKGTVLVADTLLLILNDQGLLIIAEATAERYRELGRLQVFDASRTWSPPSVVGGILLLRGPETMVALDLRNP